MRKLKVAAYARVSTDKDDQANSLANQRQYFTDFINGHKDWKLVAVYYDEGISGTQTKKRSGFNSMIQDAMNGEIDFILTKEVARFARNTVDTLSYTRKLKEVGVGVLFTIDNIDTRDRDGELRLTIMASMAQEESRKTSERVKWGQKRRMEQGVVFGRDLLGYHVKNGVLSINEAEAPVVKAIFHKYTNEGKGTHVIAKELLEEGMRPKRVKLWSNVTILRVLKNEKYVGDLCQKKTITPDYLTHNKKYNRGEEEMVYIQNHHEPIISRELWLRTQSELKKRMPSRERIEKYSNRYWNSGKMYCGECGGHLEMRTRKQKSGKIDKAWACRAANQYGSRKQAQDGEWVGCDSGYINERAIINCVQECLKLIRINKEELQQEIMKEIKQIRNFDNAVNSTDIQRESEEIREKKRRAIDLMLDGLISEEDLKEQNNWYDRELQILENRLNREAEENKIRQRQIGNMEKYISVLCDIMKFTEEDECLYREIVEKIVVYRDKTVEVWLCGIPFGVSLKISCHGKLQNYRTEVHNVDIIERR